MKEDLDPPIHRTTRAPQKWRAFLLTGVWVAFLLGLAGCSTLGQDYPKEGMEDSAYGIWTGTLPCAGCAGIEARLVLWRDPNLFRFTETYLNTAGTPKTFTSGGQWRLERKGENPELGRLQLTTSNARRTFYLERLPRGGLKMVNPDDKANGSPDEYVLKRTSSAE